MSSRGKRKFDIDPNASDPDDYDYDDAERRAAPQRRRHQRTPGAKKRPPKRPRRAYGGSDIDDDDEFASDDSFTERSESEPPEINPATGRSVRRTTKKQITYEESDADEIQDTPSESDDASHAPPRRCAKPSVEEVTRPSLIVCLKMSSRSLRTRAASKSTARGKTPDAPPYGTRRSNRLSHDIEAPIVELTDSGRHVKIVREGTRSPEPVLARATRGAKGPRMEYPSAIAEASQEDSQEQDAESAGPLDLLLAGAGTQVQASKDSTPVHSVPADPDGENDENGEGVVQESQPDGAADESEDEDGPVTRGTRKLRVGLRLHTRVPPTNNT